jgi:transposase-like protein
MAKKRAIGRYPKAFRKMAVERLKSCDNIVALSEELGVHRRLLYKWRDQLEPVDDNEPPPANSREVELRNQISQLKRLVADKTLEADFFKGALRKVEARRQSSGNAGATASTTKSGK